MSIEQIISQVESWIKQGLLSFEELERLAGSAYAKEAADDE